MPDRIDLDDFLLSGLVKGVPGGIAPFKLRDAGARRWNLLREDLPLPAAVLKTSAIDHNDRWMQSFLRLSGAVIAPHGKTTMSPALFHRQLEHGAWAMTVATVQQVQVCRAMGVDRIVLANQLVGRQAIRYVLDELAAHKELEFYCLVDSVAGVRQLAEAARGRMLQAPVNLLLEGGTMGGRTGCRDLAGALEVARAAAAAGPALRLRGVEGFEGLIQGKAAEETEAKVRAFLDFLARIAEACLHENLFAPGPIVLSAGGSAYYDLVVDRFSQERLGRETIVLTRSGCYLTHDSALYRRSFERLHERKPEIDKLGEGLRPALEVWAYVQSRPETTKAICTMGRRDVSSDADMPVPELWCRPGGNMAPQALAPGHSVTGLNDQHAHLTLPAESPLRVGDMISFGVSHPCTTFDKWQVLWLVDDDYTVTGGVRTFF
ncbi:MAG TPA: amino acid deaminase [Stellaceae bacterium]|nr:amino acid deaminase [Stellaceae bacterium]